MSSKNGSSPGELHAVEAEQCLVAALFSAESSAEAYDRMAIILKADDFYLSCHRIVFEAYTELTSLNQNTSPAILAGYIKSLPKYSDTLLHGLTAATVAPFSIANIEAYAQAVVEKSKARKIQKFIENVQKKLPNIGGQISSQDVLREMESVSLGFEDRTQENGLLRPPTVLLQKTVERLEKVSEGVVIGARTGIEQLDNKLGPMVAGDLIIIAGRPSMGKTVLALNIVEATNITFVELGKVPDLAVIFSAEMGDEKVGLRFLSSIGGINHDHLKRGDLTDEEWTRLFSAVGKYENSNIRVDDDSMVTIGIMRSKLRALVRATGKKVGLIVVDYLQLMNVDRTQGGIENRNAEITEISRGLKGIAKDWECPVVALSQLNRSVEQRSDKRPLISDLRESGAIEQDADVIMLLYRDEYYNPDSDMKGIAEINVGKARDGLVGKTAAHFQGEFQRFRSVDAGMHSYESKYGNRDN